MKDIKRITFMFYAAFAAMCYILFVVPESRDLSGTYYRGDHAGYDIYLDLRPDGTYRMEWPGCGGSCGSARGSWAASEGSLVLFLSDEKGRLIGQSRFLNIVRTYWRTVLIDDLNDYHKRYGPNGRTAFYRLNRPWFLFPHIAGRQTND